MRCILDLALNFESKEQAAAPERCFRAEQPVYHDGTLFRHLATNLVTTIGHRNQSTGLIAPNNSLASLSGA